MDGLLPEQWQLLSTLCRFVCSERSSHSTLSVLAHLWEGDTCTSSVPILLFLFIGNICLIQCVFCIELHPHREMLFVSDVKREAAPQISTSPARQHYRNKMEPSDAFTE
uniref:Uncharacterized protein n=1 Tax=Paramormyrops kingsleyae TaxID=1676925 RepID=A0A3B3SFE3_9TELE